IAGRVRPGKAVLAARNLRVSDSLGAPGRLDYAPGTGPRLGRALDLTPPGVYRR
ncbi:hypothetical protein LCGC14_2986020, partial [marine sediment metagenome]